MQRVEGDSSAMSGSNASSIAAMRVPKELRNLDRNQGSYFDLSKNNSVG